MWNQENMMRVYGNLNSSNLDSDVRDVVVRTFDNLLDDEELWVSN